MSLRWRIAAAMTATLLPLVAVLVLLDRVERRTAAEAELGELLLARLETPGEAERCAADPAAWGRTPLSRERPGPHPPPEGPPGDSPPGSARPQPGRRPPEPPGQPPPGGEGRRAHRRPAIFYAYGEDRRPARPEAPALDAGLVAAVAEGDFAALPGSWLRSEVGIVVRPPWSGGPCAFLTAVGTEEPWLGSRMPAARIWLLPVLVVFATVLVAVGPPLRRLTRLAAAMQRSAASGYTTEVPEEGGDEIAGVARAFAAAAGEARLRLAEKDARERALREFLANTTHDLMIPLTVLQGHLAALRDQAAAGAAPDKATVAGAMSEAHYLGALLHNLGAAARLEGAGRPLQLGAVGLGALVGRVVGRHRPIAAQLGVALESAVPEEELTAQADLTLLEQAVSNLVYNAVCHNREGGHAAVILERAGDDFRIRILDDGPGLSAEELERLKDRGYRGDDARTRHPGGQGLGLDIAQQVATLHGYRLELRPGAGAGLEAELRGRAG